MSRRAHSKRSSVRTRETYSFGGNTPVTSESWYQRQWRPAMAGLYLLLCLIDYGIRPGINFWFFTEFDLAETIQVVENLEPTVQIQIIETLRSEQAIPPILTEFVHLAFGAILGAAAYTRGREKIERTRRGVVARDPHDIPDEFLDDDIPNEFDEMADGERDKGADEQSEGGGFG